MEELHKKDLNEPNNHDCAVSLPEPGILDCEVKWALGSTAVCCHPVYLSNMLSTSQEMPSWMNYKLESRQVGETSTTSDNADDTTQMSESKQELENFLMTVKEESEKAGLKLNIIKTEIFF